MAQTAPPPSAVPIPRPLPRGGRPLRTRDTRPRFQPVDAVWMALPAALFVGLAFVSPAHPKSALPGLLTAAGTVAVTYLLGWRAAGRTAGIIAALLLATSAAFAEAATISLLGDVFTLLSVGALFAFVAGSSLAALGLAALAVWVRPDGILLGLMLMTLSLIQHRRRALLGAALFLAPALGAWVFSLTTGHFPMPLRPFGFDPILFHWIAAPAALVSAWFLLPFCGEYADPIRRARWLPVVLWGALLILLETMLQPARSGDHAGPLVAFLPFWFALTGAGLARLLPLMTGDIPQPALRYVIATLAVLLLVGLCIRLEWPPAPRPVPQAGMVTTALPPAVVPVPLSVTKPTLPVKQVVRPQPKPAVTVTRATAGAPKPAGPAVRLYTVRNGRTVRRSKWAIQWELTHPHQ